MADIDDIMRQIKDRGLKITPQRRLLVRCIWENGGAVSAKEIFHEMRKHLPDVSMDTVYRGLNVLCEGNILCKIERQGQGSDYEIIAGKHLHYMICSKCGKRDTFEACGISTESIPEEKRKGFLITGHRLELYGICPNCNEGEKR